MNQPFDNPPVTTPELPSLRDIDWQPLAARYLGQALMERGLLLAIMLAGLGVASSVGSMPPWSVSGAAGVIAGIFLLQVVHTLLAVPRKGYALRKQDVLFRTGLFFRSVTAVPLNRIQHVELSRGPLERAYGLATLQVFTAGGSGADLSVPGLVAETGERLREYILGRIGDESEH